jgi:hypothetical protein
MDIIDRVSLLTRLNTEQDAAIATLLNTLISARDGTPRRQ